MAKNTPKPQPAGINVGDIVYALFKHKWKLILVSLLAMGGAAAYYFRAPVVYQSQSKMIVRYLVDRSSIDQVDTTASASGSRGNDSVMSSQLAILTSWDLASQVGATFTGDLRKRLVPDATGEVSEAEATGAVFSGLTAEVPKSSNIILLTYRHSDPAVARTVLDAVVTQYQKKHLEYYRSAATASLVAGSVSDSDTALKAAETTLLDLKKTHKIRSVSVSETVASLSVELARAESELNDARTKQVEQEARVAAIERLFKGKKTGDEKAGATEAPVPSASLPEPGAPGEVVRAAEPVDAAAPGVAAAPTEPAKPGPDSRTVAEYQQLIARINSLRATNASLLTRFTPENEAVRVNQAQLDQAERERTTLEEKHPELASAAQVTGGSGGVSGLDLLAERAGLAAAEARTQAITNRISELEQKLDDITNAIPALSRAERDKEIKEGNYKYLMTSQEKAQIDQKLIAGSAAPNIIVVQRATPATRDVAMRDKIALGIAGGGPAAALGLILLFGVLLDRTIKRPAEFEEKLGFPLMLAIPYFKRLGQGSPQPRLKGPSDGSKQLATSDDGAPPPWDPGHAIRPHFEAIRDRLGLYFETHGLDHKPKLIAVTGQTSGAGASTVASGIAAALSETGDGKVLLVDMGGTQGAAHPFFDGRPAPALSTALRSSRGAEEAAENLFLAKADGTSPGVQSIGAARLSRLMPDLKASYFDYIIFDMPPLGNTSPTPSMAAFMDQIVVVVEAEASTRDEILRQHRDLTENHAKVSVVLNKVIPHGPKAIVGSV